MMNITGDQWVAITGWILTFIGTGISIWMAYLSIGAARQAKSLRDEIRADREKFGMLEMIPAVKKALDDIRKIITPVDKNQKGINATRVLADLQVFVDGANRQAARIQSEDYRVAVVEIQQMINEYRREQSQDVRYTIADRLHERLIGLSSVVDGYFHK